MTTKATAGKAPAKRATKKAESTGYDADDLVVLEGLDAVRKRPGMYIGDTGTRGLHHLLAEIVDNSVDEAAAGHASVIKIELFDDGSAQVSDNGRGIPVGTERSTGLSGMEVVFTKLHAGGKFGTGGYATAGGLHGVGASVVNALSLKLEAKVMRDGVVHEMWFQHGKPGKFGAGNKFRESHGPTKGAKVAKGTTGTIVRFWPDPAIFGEEPTFTFETVCERLAHIAFLVPGLTIDVVDHRTGATKEYKSLKGLPDFVEYLGGGDAICDTISLMGEGTYTETVPVLKDGVMKPAEVERNCEVQVALRWVNGWDSRVVSYVNTVPTPTGGTHVAGFNRAVTTAVNEALRDAKILRAKESNPSGDDVQEGLVAVVRVIIPEPQFEGQTKSALGTTAAQSIVYKVVADGLRAWANGGGKKTQVRRVLDKVVNASRARAAARLQRDTVRRKNALESSSLPAKLADCRSKDSALTEILLVEGDSAAGPCKGGRDSATQAVLPLRGKILNTLKASPSDVLKNAECQGIFAALGAGFGKSFDLDACRYGRVILLCDADVDGSHIRCLLLTLFHTYCRPLLEAGRVYAAMPPLYAIKVSGSTTPVFAYSDAERDKLLAKFEKEGKTVRGMSRFKGLGEMSVDELAETTLDPKTRSLRRLTVDDAAAAMHAFELCMGDAVEPRRDFIVSHSANISLDELDV
jgi:DNA gyrase subunit B